MDFPVADWEAIPLDTYKALLTEIKEGFSATTEEIVSCTDKSIKCLLAFMSYVLAIGIYVLKNTSEVSLLGCVILLLFSAYNVYLGNRIIRLRPSHTPGLLPENVLSVDYNLNSGFDEDEKSKLFYYKAIITYTKKTEENKESNDKRAKKYDHFFSFTLFLVLIILIFVLCTISSHPVSAKS